jgi:ferredoxin
MSAATVGAQATPRPQGTTATDIAPDAAATGNTTAVTLHIDWTRCDGRGLCAELLPEVLDRDDWGYPRARDGSPRDVAVPRGLRRHAADAVAACPVLALRLRGAT